MGGEADPRGQRMSDIVAIRNRGEAMELYEERENYAQAVEQMWARPSRESATEVRLARAALKAAEKATH